MYKNNEYNFAITKKADVVRISDGEVVSTIFVEIEQQPYENAAFVGSGIASGGVSALAFTYDDVNEVMPYLFWLHVDGVKYMITSKQKSLLQKEVRSSIKKAKQQTILTLE